jgi:hypothetical protein
VAGEGFGPGLARCAGFWKSVECLKENCASGLRDGVPVIGIPIEGRAERSCECAHPATAA